MAMLQGGCQLALGAYATFTNGLVKLHVWYEGQYIETEHKSSEGAAMLAFEALGRPVGAK
jgi:porphobilinogen deaminase